MMLKFGSQILLIHCIFTVFMIFCHVQRSNGLVNQAMVRTWAETLGNELKEMAETATKSELIKSEFGAVGYRDIDPEIELDFMAANMSEYLRNKSDVAWAAREALEQREMKAGNETMGLDNPSSGKFFRYFNPKDNLTNRVIYNHEEDKFQAENYTERLKLKENANMFNMETNDIHSAVHMPTPIYPRREKILSQIDWSNIDELYRREKEFSRDLGWQFFCSETGFMRFYPSRIWPYDIKDRKLDMFDCRSTEWYIDGATNSKNVMIMLDHSGSMLGQRFEIAKQLIETLLETLSENDFFNIMLFNSNVTWLDECYAGEMIQATQRNKKLLRSKLGEHPAKGIAAYEYALTEAFSILLGLNVTANWTDERGLAEGEPSDPLYIRMRSGRVWRLTDEYKQAVDDAHSKNALGCNSAIMLVTDGADDFYTKIFQEYNKERKVRVFSFLVGREATDFTRVRHMACNNNGFFVHIQDLADVTEKVQQYIKVMSRPLGYRQKTDSDKRTQMIWTGAYYERLYTTEQKNNRGYWIRAHVNDPKGLKMVTTVAYPVVTNHTFRGVAGVTVPMIEIQQMAPNFKLGTNGYTFLVDNNGYTMFHPQLRPMHGYRQKPNYNSMDILELEGLSGNTELRKNLVDGVSSKKYRTKFNATVLVMVEDEKRIYVQKNNYYHRKLEGTLFSRYCIVNNTDADVSPEKAMQIYAKQMSAVGMLPELCRLRKDLVERLLSDARISKLIDSEWSAKWRSDQQHGIHLVFVSLTSGLTRFADMKLDMRIAYHDPTPVFEIDDDSPSNGTKDPTQAPFVAAPSYVHYITERKKGPDEVFYKRAMRFPNEELVFDVNLNNRVYHTEEYLSAYGMKENISLLVTAVRAINIDGKAPIGVTGFEMLYDSLARMVNRISNNQCLDRERGLCYLLDEHGYVVYSSLPFHYGNFTQTYQMQELGKHFGDLPEGGPQFFLMDQFKNKKIYLDTLYVDFQSLCIPQIDNTASGVSKILSPIYHIIKVLHWLYNEVGLLFAEFGIIGLISQLIMPAEAFTVTFQSEAEGMPCDKAATFYIRNELATSSNWEIKSKGQVCDDKVGCKVGAYVSRIPATNLVFVYVKPLVGDCVKRHTNNVTCIKSMQLELMNKLTKGKKMTQYFEVFNGSDKGSADSECRLRSRYRKKPMMCYDMNPNETEGFDFPCAGGEIGSLNFIVFSISLCTLVVAIFLS